MTIEKITKKLERLDNDEYLQNLIAQANARSILLNTEETTRGFPRYTIKDDALNLLAFQYLNIGCQFAEAQDLNKARYPLEVGAKILDHLHSAELNKKDGSDYFALTAALAYYVSFQYSKSYILIGKTETNTKISQLVSMFLKRDFSNLQATLYEQFIDDSYSDQRITARYLEGGDDSLIYEITIAKALHNFLNYLFTGRQQAYEAARDTLEILKEIAELQQDPGIWWVIRLLLLIANGFQQSGLRNVLRGWFDIDRPILKSYINSLVYIPDRGIFELFITQRSSLEKVLRKDNSGSIVSIPTSSGKTRIAEIAILHCVNSDPDAKILYVAPFRSLAFEIENSLSKILRSKSISVSHLYGGSLYSALDQGMVDDSNVIIVTPEKAKAILRGNDDLVSQIKLIILDEGHLLGASKRLISNEVFYEELRLFVNRNVGRFLLLSAVLPNAEELSTWLTGSEDSVYRDSWRPSDERFGTLEWNGAAVTLNWLSTDKERECFNANFVRRKKVARLPRQRVDRYFPESKNDAVAATAYRLSKLGPVLLFVGLKKSVFVMAASFEKCIDNDDIFEWSDLDAWKAFELSCTEVYGADNNKWLNYAKVGILCHSAELHGDVRLPLERLMRTCKPRVIICTSTLGQGVNLGVSTVIFSTYYQAGTPLSSRDFWNIAGRAGRAFIDNEGKVLVALDTTIEDYKIVSNRKRIEEYFDRDNMDLAQSGLLISINELMRIAADQNVNFAHLLELVADNDISSLGDDAAEIDSKLDWIDDTILSLHTTFNQDADESTDWVDNHFRKSLAAIQASFDKDVQEQVVGFMKARLEGVRKKVGADRGFWKSVVKSGIPLNSDLEIEKQLPDIINLIEQFSQTHQDIDDLIKLSKELESILMTTPVLLDEGEAILSDQIDQIRDAWYHGEAMSQIFAFNNAENIITKLYSFNLPWLFNGISKKLKLLELNDEAEIVERLAVLCEVGLPRFECAKIYHAGIRSRVAAIEVGTLFEDSDKSIREYRNDLIKNQEMYIELVNETAQDWLKLLRISANQVHYLIDKVQDFTFDVGKENGYKLFPVRIKSEQYLVSEDLSEMFNDEDWAVDFSEVNSVPGIYFRYNASKGVWQMQVDNPYVQIRR